MKNKVSEGLDNPALDVSISEDNTSAVSPPSTNGQVATPDPPRVTSEVDLDDKEDLRCGYRNCKPRCLQFFNNPKWMLVWLSWFSFVQGFVVNGVNNVNTSSLERRFGLSSSQVSLVSIAYDISAGICVVPVSYIGGYSHQPRMLTAAALVMSLGSFIMSIPHFATGTYELKDAVSDTCDLYDNSTICGGGSNLDSYLGVFMLGQFLHGLGGSILYTLGIVFLDTSVHAKDSPMYQGIMYTFSTLGPAVGYLLGGMFLEYYVDFNVIDSDELLITSKDPRWVGAWWIGFLASGSLFITIFFLLSPYPRELPHAAQVRAMRVSQTHANGSEEVCKTEGFGTHWRDFPRALLMLLKNPVNMLITGAGICEGITTSGMATFLTKLIENQFKLTAGTAALVSGGLVVPASAGGMFLGGLISKIGKFEIRKNLIFSAIANALSIALSFSLLARCPAANLAGVFKPYPNSSLASGLNLTSQCNAGCHCSQQSYEPLCSSSGIEYFSPCHAGCLFPGEKNEEGVKSFFNCSCVIMERTSWEDDPIVSTAGHCSNGCTQLYIFCVIFFFVVLCTFLQSVPGINISLRCVPESQRTFAIGIKWVFMRFLGTVLGPVIYGSIFDSACMVWQESCGEQGSCWIYDGDRLAWYLIGISVSVKICCGICYIAAYIVYKPPKSAEKSNGATPTGVNVVENGNGELSNGTAASNSEGYCNPGYEEDRL